MWLKLPAGQWLNCDKIKEIYCDVVEGHPDEYRIYFIFDADCLGRKSRLYVKIEPNFFTLEQATDELVRAIAQNRHNRIRLTEKGDLIAT